jgi:hypothetical protein
MLVLCIESRVKDSAWYSRIMHTTNAADQPCSLGPFYVVAADIEVRP